MEKRIVYCTILLLLIMNVLQCKKQAEISKTHTSNLHVISDSLTIYKNSLGTKTASISTLQLNQKQLKNTIIKKDHELSVLTKEYKELKSVIKYTTQTEFDTIYIPLRSYSSLPKFEYKGIKKDKWFSLDYKINNDSLILSSFKTWTETALITGVKQNWFLGKKMLKTEVTFTNPHITVKSLKSAEITITEKWYEKWYFWLLSGFTAGLLLK